MADDVNKSNKSINGGASQQSENIIRQYEQLKNKETVESEYLRQYGKKLRAEHREEREEYSELKQNGANIADLILQAQRVGLLQSRRMDVSERFLESRVRTDLAAQNTLMSKTSTFLSDARSRSRINTIGGTSDLYESAFRESVNGGSYFEQERIKATAEGKISSLGEQLQVVASAKRFDQKKYSTIAGQIEAEEVNVARAEKAMGILRKQGDDPASQAERVEKYLSIASKQSRIQEAKVNAGSKGFTLGDIEKEQAALYKNLRELSDAFKSGKADLEKFTAETKKATDRLNELDDIKAGVKEAGGGFLGGKGTAMLEGAMFLGGVVSNVAGNVNTTFGNNDITQMNNRTAFTQMGNAIYDKAEAAVNGNSVDAALDIVSSDEFAKAFADKNRKLAHGTGWTQAFGNMINNVGSGMMKGAMVGAGVGGTIGLAAGGVGAAPGAAIGTGVGMAAGAISGLSDSMSEFGNLIYGNVGADASIRSYQAAKALTAEERKIRSTQMQKFYNHGLSIYNNASGLGNANAVAAGETLMNQNTLLQLANAGVSATQASSMLSIMKQGGSFNFDKEGLPAMINAGKMNQAGVMGKEEYMSAWSRLRSMGGGDNDLQKMITSGLENAKNINQMVDASVQMSTNLANLGVSGISATSGLLNSSAQMLRGIGVDPNIAVGMAANGMANYNKAIQDQGFNLGNIVERAQLRKDPNFRNAGVFQLNALSNMSVEQLAVFRAAEGGDEDAMKEAKRLARRRGISDLMFDASGKIKSGAVNTLGRSALTGALLNAGLAGMSSDVLSRLESGKELTGEQAAALDSLGFDQETARAALGKQASISDSFYAKRKGQDRDTTANIRDAKSIGMGKKYSKDLDPTGDAFKNVENLMQAVSEAVDPEKFGTAVAKAAEEFKIPVTDFGKHVDKMGKILDSVSKQQERMLNMMGESRASDYVKLKSKSKKP